MKRSFQTFTNNSNQSNSLYQYHQDHKKTRGFVCLKCPVPNQMIVPINYNFFCNANHQVNNFNSSFGNWWSNFYYPNPLLNRNKIFNKFQPFEKNKLYDVNFRNKQTGFRKIINNPFHFGSKCYLLF